MAKDNTQPLLEKILDKAGQKGTGKVSAGLKFGKHYLRKS
jgi:6-phosphogluconate dehydrogenase